MSNSNIFNHIFSFEHYVSEPKLRKVLLHRPSRGGLNGFTMESQSQDSCAQPTEIRCVLTVIIGMFKYVKLMVSYLMQC